MKLHWGAGKAWIPHVKPEQIKNSRSWSFYLERAPTVYALPLRNKELVTVRLHLTRTDELVYSNRSPNGMVQWLSNLADQVACCCQSDDAYLEYEIAGKTWAIVTEAYRHADQEKASGGASSYPGQTRVAGGFDRSYFEAATDKSDYEHIAILTLIGWARGMLVKVGVDGVSEPVDAEEIVVSPGDEHAYPAYPARVYKGKLPALRPSISLIPHSLDRLDQDVTNFGGTYVEPDKDEPESLGAIRIGPLIATPSPALKDCLENTIAGVHRHWQEIPLRWMTTETHAILDKANTIMMLYMGYVAMEDPGRHMSAIKLPMKWGCKLQDAMWESVEQDVPQLYKMIQKLRELGLDVNKLPRLVLSMGPRATASNTLFACPTESVRNHGFPHLMLKYMTIEEQDDRICEFHSNLSRPIWLKGQRIYKTLVSTDNAKMDSTVCTHDRDRYLRAVRSLLSKLRDGIRALRDPVAGHGSVDQQRRLFIMNKFLDMTLKAMDMGVGSGERFTTDINRHTKLLNKGFELVRSLGWELGFLVFRLWLLYEPGDHKDLVESEISRIENGAYLRHHDSAYDLGTGDGDDDVSAFCSLDPPLLGQASERMVEIHKDCYKLLEPAYKSEPQNAIEILSRVHIPRFNIHFPVPKKWLQKTILCYVDAQYDSVSHYAELTGAHYAQLATALIQRVHAARQLPLLRWLGLALAEMYADRARWAGWTTSVYSDDDRRRGYEDGDYVLRAMCEDIRDWLHSAVIDFEVILEVLADGEPIPAGLDHELALADADWAQMTVTRDMVLHQDNFVRLYPVSKEIRDLLGITEWAAPSPDDKLAKVERDGPSLSSGCAASLGAPRRTCAGQLVADLPLIGEPALLAVGVAKPGCSVGRGTPTATEVESLPAGTCHEGVASMHRGSDTKTTVMATVPASVAEDVGPSGASTVCGSGIPGPSEPGEGQCQAQKVLLSEALPSASAADSRGCQPPVPSPLIRTSAVGGVFDALAGSPQSPVQEVTHHSDSRTASGVLVVAPGSDHSEWFPTVLAHLRAHGSKTVDQLIEERALPIFGCNGKVAQGKRRKFANQTLNHMNERGLIVGYTPAQGKLTVWFAIAPPPGLSAL